MRLLRRRVFVLLLALTAVIFAASVEAAQDGAKLTVAAASDMTFALREMVAGFERETGASVSVSLGSTGLLAAQIRNGAPFDVYLAADGSVVDKLAEDGFIIPASITPYATGVIVLATKAVPGAAVSGFKDLLSPRVKWIALANPSHAPYGKAGKEALMSAGVWDAIKDKVVYGENVSQVLKFVESGSVDAGIIALSVAGSSQLKTAPVDPALYKPIEQAAGVLKTSKEAATAMKFVRYLTGEQGVEILKKYGFGAPTKK